MRILFAVASCVLLPAAAAAQGSITGTVKDTSGAVLPGVTVEASSPVLIERSRTVVTDATGQYRFVDLRPGIYALTFTLSGFGTVRREGVELTGSFTATVSAELRVGDLAETVTVTGETPIVDVQSASRQRVFGHDVVDAIPTAKNQYNVAVLIPGISMGGGATQQDVGGSAGLEASYGIVVHGSKLDSQRITQNGVTINTFLAGGYGGAAAPNPSAVQEFTIDYSGVSAELPTGGVRINLIPKEGGNAFRGVVFGSFANSCDGHQQPDRGAEGSRPADPQHDQDHLGFQSGIRRSDPEGPALVLRQRPAECRRNLRRRHVSGQHQRPQCLDVQSRHDPAGIERQHVEGRPGSGHLAGVVAAQARALLRSAVTPAIAPTPSRRRNAVEAALPAVVSRSSAHGRATGRFRSPAGC